MSSKTQPSVQLYNAASGIEMPVIGLGTGAYGSAGNKNGEHWTNDIAEKAVIEWLALGGRRIDTSNDYGTQKGVGRAIKNSNISRSDIFITTKVGPRFPLGFDTILQQANDNLKDLQTDYVDLVLIHWPGAPGGKPNMCATNQTSFKVCRQESWRALVEFYHDGKAKAIGVSNYEIKHLQEILEMDTVVPAVNQFEFHPYWHEDELVKFCEDHKITVNGYSSVGCPDHMSSPDNSEHWQTQIIDQPIIKEIAKKYGKTPGQVLLCWSWQQHIVVNARSWNATHMSENLKFFDFNLTGDEMNTIRNLPTPPNRKVCADPNGIP